MVVQDVSWASTAAGRGAVSRATGTATGHRTAWTTLTSRTAVSLLVECTNSLGHLHSFPSFLNDSIASES